MSEKKRQKKAGQDKGKRNKARRAEPSDRGRGGHPAERATAASRIDERWQPERRPRPAVSLKQSPSRNRAAAAGRRSSAAPPPARRKAAREGKGK